MKTTYFPIFDPIWTYILARIDANKEYFKQNFSFQLIRKTEVIFPHGNCLYILYTNILHIFCIHFVCIHFVCIHFVYILYTFCLQNVYRNLSKYCIHFVYKMYTQICRNMGYILYTKILYTFLYILYTSVLIYKKCTS